jgi:hypothetical protein
MINREHRAAASDIPHARDDADYGHVSPQRDDRRLNFGDDGKPQVGFLQSHAARFKQDERANDLAALAVAQRELERGCDLAA